MITRFSFLLAFVLLLAACTTPIKTEVTRFHALPAPQGESFVIVAKQKDLEGSLELQTYAQVVSNYLRSEGFVPAGTAQPDLVVKIDFSISGPVEQTRRSAYNYPFYGSFYYYGGHHHHRFWRAHYLPYRYPRYGYGFGYYPYEYTYIVYERTFEMAIQRRDGAKLFEGRVTSLGRNKVLPEVIPYLVQAMFTEFPGQSGTTLAVRIKPEKGAGY